MTALLMNTHVRDNLNALTPTTATLTTTGTTISLGIPSGRGDLIVLLNNATLLTVQGMPAGYDGQHVTFHSIGAGQVDFVDESGAAAVTDRLVNICRTGNTSLSPGYGTATFVYHGGAVQKWRLLSHDQGGWIDYSATSTVVGWGSFTTKVIKYWLQGRTLHVNWYIDGTSNSTSTSFTLPFTTPSGPNQTGPGGRIFDNGAYTTTTGAWVIGPSASGITHYVTNANSSGTTWTAANQKISSGSIAIEVG